MGHRHDHLDRVARRLGVLEAADAHHVAGRLLDPVAAGDAEIEHALGHVRRDLLRAQDPHLVDARIVDLGPVGDIGIAVDPQIGGLEQIEGGLLERALGQDQT